VTSATGSKTAPAATRATDAPPTVSIGLPVFNGEKHIAAALDSLLAQDFDDFELIVSDNASTDRTARIVEGYARRDPRVRLVRNSANVGAAANFGRTFELSGGRYFMWAADDDLWSPRYVGLCVRALESTAGAVLACTSLQFIDQDGRVMAIPDQADFDNPDLSSPSARGRLETLLRQSGWYLTYGLARSEALRRTHLYRNVYAGDMALMVEIALLGPCVKVPEVAYFNRRQPGKTEVERAQRQGLRWEGGAGKLFASTRVQEAVSAGVMASPLPWLTRRALVAWVYYYTAVASRRWRKNIKPELRPRLALALRQAHVRESAKFFSLWVVVSFLTTLGRVRRSVSR
jgi:glycosyltransferase involved in cell wall biosynthesis